MTEVYELLNTESTNAQRGALPSISTCTLFDGMADEDFLERRITDIVKCNPWLEGRLIKRNKKVALEVPKFIDAQSNHRFEVMRDIPRLGTYEEYVDFFSNKLVKKSNLIIGKNLPVFKTVLGIINSSKYLVLMSMSHDIADGYSYYKILNMISANQKPYSLNFSRKQKACEDIEELTQDGNHFMQSYGTLFNFIGQVLKGCSTKLSIDATIDSDRIKALKQQYTSGDINAEEERTTLVPFISTNDVVVSTYFEAISCDVGVMSVNFRGRLDDLDENDVGNYEGIIAYERKDYLTPESIRYSLLNNFRRLSYSSQSSFFSGFWRRCRAKVALITNWSGFYEDLEIPGSTVDMHWPLFENQPHMFDIAIIYRANKEKLKLMTFESLCQCAENITQSGIIKV